MSLIKKSPAPVLASMRSFVIDAARISVAAIALLLPFAAAAEPIQLKLSFFASEHTETYQHGVKPFVDAVNAEGKGLLAIKVYSNGALGKAVAEQPGLVLDGVADIAWVVPGQTPYRFPDNDLLELPGLFRDLREGTLTYTHLIAANALRGYQDFFVIGAYLSAPSIIHSRKPIASLAALKGQKIRANNPTEAQALEQLGAIPTVMPAPRLADAIASGAVDGAVMSPTGLFQFRASRVAKNHYLLGIGAAPLVVIMNREKFDGLPEAAKAIIRKYSGQHAAAIWIDSFGATERRSLEKIISDPERKAIEPSPSDLQAAHKIFHAIIEAWDTKDAHNHDLLKAVEAHLATIRSVD
jgi:TRAP-type C4-dicarboxylate transport system substrate-binding protein